jgi:hypothetical protein
MTLVVGAVIHYRFTLLSTHVAFARTLGRRLLGSGTCTSASTHSISGSIFDYELASVKLMVLGVYQRGRRVFCACEIDKCEPGGGWRQQGGDS